MSTWVWPVPGVVPWEIPARETAPNSFAVKRKHDIHTGIDIYAPEGQPVHAVEAGTVITVDDFTGSRAESPWWEDTRAVFIQGESGVVGYGEIQEIEGIVPGAHVEQGQLIGHVKRVLKENKDHPNPKAMLHIELYEEGYNGSGEWWTPDEEKPHLLLDPTQKLRGAWARVTERRHRDIKPIPTDITERKNLVGWLIDHRLWHYPLPLKDGETEEEVRAKDYWAGGSFFESIEVELQYVDPTTESLQGEMATWDDPRNIAPRVWVEGGGWTDLSKDSGGMPEPPEGWNKWNKWQSVHDYNLNTGGETLEEAYLNLARLVEFFYNDDGTDREDAPERCEGEFTLPHERGYKSGCKDAGDGFCEVCGFIICPHEDEEDE